MRRTRQNLFTDALVGLTVASLLAEWAWHRLRRRPLVFPR